MIERRGGFNLNDHSLMFYYLGLVRIAPCHFHKQASPAVRAQSLTVGKKKAALRKAPPMAPGPYLEPPPLDPVPDIEPPLPDPGRDIDPPDISFMLPDPPDEDMPPDPLPLNAWPLRAAW